MLLTCSTTFQAAATMPSTSTSLGNCVSSSATLRDSLAVLLRKGLNSTTMNSSPHTSATTSSRMCVVPWLLKLASAPLM
jgi:hypothetical protein